MVKRKKNKWKRRELDITNKCKRNKWSVSNSEVNLWPVTKNPSWDEIDSNRNVFFLFPLPLRALVLGPKQQFYSKMRQTRKKIPNSVGEKERIEVDFSLSITRDPRFPLVHWKWSKEVENKERREEIKITFRPKNCLIFFFFRFFSLKSTWTDKRYLYGLHNTVHSFQLK